jgi:hypothetical protein
MTHKAEVQQAPNGGNTYKLKFNLTMGEMYALYNALSAYPTANGKDVCAYLANALVRSGIRLP